MAEAVAKPSPAAEGLSKSYWDGTKVGKLMLQRCLGCGRIRHYPQVVCSECYADSYDWIQASGAGTLHSWTVAHHAYHSAFAGDVPYVLATVDLEEGVRALGILDRSVGEPRLGMPLRATFPLADDGFGKLTFLRV